MRLERAHDNDAACAVCFGHDSFALEHRQLGLDAVTNRLMEAGRPRLTCSSCRRDLSIQPADA
jgi:hypothetical protein